MRLSIFAKFCLAVAFFIFLLLLWIYEGAAQDYSYRIISKNNALIWQNIEITFDSPMCWNDVEGWCDDLTGYRQRWIVADWAGAHHGIIYKNADSCFIWILRDDYGADNNPHIAEHSWITCP